MSLSADGIAEFLRQGTCVNEENSLLKYTLLLLTVLLSNSSLAEDVTQWALPDGAKARLGKGWPYEIAYSPDGNLLAVASTIGIWVYDVGTGTEIELLTDHSDSVDSVCVFSRWSYACKRRQRQDHSSVGCSHVGNLHTLEGHTKDILSVAFSPDSMIVASGSSDGSVRLWEPRSGNLLGVLEGHKEAVYSVDFHRDGQMLVSGGSGGAIRLWDVHTVECLQTVDRNWGMSVLLRSLPMDSCLPAQWATGRLRYGMWVQGMTNGPRV